MKKKFFNSDKILSLTAILMSLCTLIVFTYQTSLIRKQQYASAYPHLQLINIRTGTSNYNYIMKNNGIGPALIKSIKIISPKGKVFDDFNPYVLSMLKPTDSISYAYTNISPGVLVPANEEIQLIAITNNLKGNEKTKKLYEILNQDELNVEIEYESVFNERWMITHTSASPIKID